MWQSSFSSFVIPSGFSLASGQKRFFLSLKVRLRGKKNYRCVTLKALKVGPARKHQNTYLVLCKSLWGTLFSPFFSQTKRDLFLVRLVGCSLAFLSGARLAAQWRRNLAGVLRAASPITHSRLTRLNEEEEGGGRDAA